MHHPERFVSPWYLDAPIPAAHRLSPDAAGLIMPPLTAATVPGRMAQLHAPIATRVAASAAASRGAVCLGGDCCTTIAVLAGLQRAGLDPLLVWLDAHGDFNTPETSPSGFLGGMPLAMIVGRGDQSLAAAAGLRSLAEPDALLVNARDLDPLERAALDASAVRRVADPARIAEHLPPDRPIYVHLDADIMDPADAPAVHYPVPGGPSLAAVEAACRRLRNTGRLVAASLTLWDFDKDADGRTARACFTALQALTG